MADSYPSPLPPMNSDAYAASDTRFCQHFCQLVAKAWICNVWTFPHLHLLFHFTAYLIIYHFLSCVIVLQVEEELLEQEFLERCFQEMLEEEDQDWFIPSRDLNNQGVGQLQQQLNGLSVSDHHNNLEEVAVSQMRLIALRSLCRFLIKWVFILFPSLCRGRASWILKQRSLSRGRNTRSPPHPHGAAARTHTHAYTNTLRHMHQSSHILRDSGGHGRTHTDPHTQACTRTHLKSVACCQARLGGGGFSFFFFFNLFISCLFLVNWGTLGMGGRGGVVPALPFCGR